MFFITHRFEREMDGMREISRAYYERASEADKISIQRSFAKLDIDGNGKINLVEFKKSVSLWLSTDGVFEKLDENGDGCLDFEEFLCLYYMEEKVEIGKCSGCSELMVGPYFSCLLCLGRGADTYDLCCTCYRRRRGSSHEHSSQYMVDHHSLLMLFRHHIADDEKVRNKKEMEELRKVTKAYYRAASPQVKELAYEFFQSMDTDGDGRVDLSEFIAFMRREGYPFMQNRSFFEQLDLNSDGTLNFFEVMTLYYIIKSGRPFCDCCAKFIPGIFFSCVECFNNPNTSFHLCCDCYRMAKCNHNHDGRSQFLDNYALLQAIRDPGLAHASGANSNEACDEPTDAIVPVHHDSIVHTQNAIDPAPSDSKWNKFKTTLEALEVAVSVGNLSTTLCTIM
ncbi:uncharacterized protein LOC121774856 [Salvia splendens]|uniref:uncharacterized protein LOC121774856 n=1 Tax=Salvia splendens TaxID=180675 RepID=UPI0011043432|nr:uncharacterized protein LOC121774856 [Salvia splendens]